MIVTVTLNAALDVTYAVPRLTPRGVHRVTDVWRRGGGKGVNVARLLHALGEATLACGLVGGPTGRAVLADLAAAGVPARFYEIGGESRRSVTVVADGDATLFNEAGPHVRDAEWTGFLRLYAAVLTDTAAAVVVLSGSLPRGVPDDAYAVLADEARRAGARVVLDADGAALRLGLAGRPDVAKPNEAELAGAVSAWPDRRPSRGPDGCAQPDGRPARRSDRRRPSGPDRHASGHPDRHASGHPDRHASGHPDRHASGHPDGEVAGLRDGEGAGHPAGHPPSGVVRDGTAPHDESALLRGARELIDAGAGAVVATRGAAGLVAVTEAGAWAARPPARLRGNPTGAGDAVAAALARALRRGAVWPDAIADAVALSAAAVVEPVAGAADLDAYRRWRPLVEVERVTGPQVGDGLGSSDQAVERRIARGRGMRAATPGREVDPEGGDGCR